MPPRSARDRSWPPPERARGSTGCRRARRCTSTSEGWRPKARSPSKRSSTTATHGWWLAAIATPPPETDARLEFLLAELAHEVRNPLVTVKTFAEHLPALLEDTELRARFAALTTEAIDRIDGLLENVLAFARLGPPHPTAVEVGPVLDLSANGVVTMHFATGNEAAARLRRLAAPGGNHTLTDPTLLPLAFTLARATLARGGGVLDIVPEPGGSASLVMRLPVAEA